MEINCKMENQPLASKKFCFQNFYMVTSVQPFSSKIQWHKNHAKPTLYVTTMNFQINPPKILFIYFPHYVSCHVMSFTLHLISHDMMFQVVIFFSKKYS
jgi:hypothetical protein